MKHGFTLIELLVVVAIMGLLGTASVGGYRQMQRGMEERGTAQNVLQFLEAAKQRAVIDRQPTAVFFWNEYVRRASDSADSDILTDIVVGRAVAVRRHGRITEKVGDNYLVDEFGDFEQYDDEGNYVEGPRKSVTIRLYKMNGDESSRQSSVVYETPELISSKTPLDFAWYDTRTVTAGGSSESSSRSIQKFGYRIKQNEGASWKVGTAYGLEFQSIELPAGYIFGTSLPSGGYVSDAAKPIFFTPDQQNGSVVVSSLRPGSGGTLEAKSVCTCRVTAGD